MDKKPLQKERDNRSAEKKDLTFHPYSITPETAHTAILLLESEEPEILCQTLRAITKFSAQDMQNREILYNLEAIRYVLPHIDHAETNIRRFALKALAQLTALPRGPEQILEDSQNLNRLAFMLAKSEDVLVLEFTSLNLSELTREPKGCEQVIAANILNTLFARMKTSPDPDVQKNCLQVLNNLLEEPVCAVEVSRSPQFSWPPVLALMRSEYVAIQQAALTTVDQLICRYKDDLLQKGFRASTGVLDLCDILESYNFRDVHAEVLRVLRNFVETEDNAAHLFQSGCLLRLLAYLEVALPALKPHCLAVLTKMSSTENGRDALFQTNTELVFCQQLVSSGAELLADAALGVARMTRLMASAVRMSDTNVVEALCAIIADESQTWFYVRLNALRAMCELCRIIPKAAYSVAEPKTFGPLRNVNKKYKDNPIEGQRLAVQCYIHLLNYHISSKAMLTGEFIQELLNNLQRIDICLKIKTCTVLTGLMGVDDHAKNLFTRHKGEEVISKNLSIEHIGMRTALCNVIMAIVTYEGADVYLELGTVHYMVENKQARYVVGAWEPALEAIFKHHPSAKFAYTGRLDINDYTTEGFYVMKRLQCPFPTLRALVAPSSSSPPSPPPSPVLVCMFLPGAGAAPSDVDDYSNQKMAVPPAQSRLPSLPDDPDLRSYLLKLRQWFGEHSKSLHFLDDGNYDARYRAACREVSADMRAQALLLAQFVQQQMCGADQQRDCSLPSVELHLAELAAAGAAAGAAAVGLGRVRCGGPLERAVLYKVLADRAQLPCELRRAAADRAWCQLALPDLPPEESLRGGECRFPLGLVRANLVVDLMSQPARLLPRGGVEARRVCGGACPQPRTTRDEPAPCACTDRSDDSSSACYSRSTTPSLAASRA